MVRPATAASSSMNIESDGRRRNDDEAKYRGVRKRKWGKWVSEIRLPNSRERIWLGSYDSAEKAARAFDAALFCLRGNTANFNFPHEPPNIPGGTDLHPSQIQEVAARYANSYSSSPSRDQLHDPSAFSNNYQLQQTSTTSMDQLVSSSYFLDQNNNNNNIPDFGIFPGFDDYFMPLDQSQPSFTAHDYGAEEVVYDGMYSQDPCHLWNF